LSLLIFQGAFWKGWQSMITLLEVLALVDGGRLSRWRSSAKRVRRGSALALVLTGFCASLLLQAAPAMASETPSRRIRRRGERRNHQGGYFSIASACEWMAQSKEDVYLFAHNATSTGNVKGDVIAFAQSLDVNGEVDEMSAHLQIR